MKFLFLLLTPILAWANPIEFGVPGVGVYRVVLSETQDGQDYFEMRYRGGWERRFTGTITQVILPIGAVINDELPKVGARANDPKMIVTGNFRQGIRMASKDRALIDTSHGVIELPMRVEVIQEIRELDAHNNFPGVGSFVIFSVRNGTSGFTVMFKDEKLDKPVLIDAKFHAEELNARYEDDKILIGDQGDRLDPEKFEHGYAPSAVAIRKFSWEWEEQSVPQNQQVPAGAVDQQIGWLESHAPGKGDQSWVKASVKALLLREFDLLKKLDKEGQSIVDDVSERFARLWSSGELPGSKIIRATIEHRLETLVEDRSECELSLVKNFAKHSSYYERHKIKDGLNQLYRRLEVLRRIKAKSS